MNGVVYCRVSSKEQIEGTSLESQETACREYARSKDIRLLKVFVEQGESAKFADRTKLVELIDFCRENKGTVEVLLVWKVDRFARNVADHYSVKSTLAKYGVRIVSVTEPIDANPEGKLMETILAGFAEFDNGVRTTRTIQGMRRKIQEGIFPFKPPLGYRSPTVAGDKKTLPDVPDEAVFGLLQKAWKEFATGTHTQAEMGRLMQAWGLSATGGGPFLPQFLYRLFTNPYYAGILRDSWSGEEYQGKHVAMVTPEEFALVQIVLARRNRSLPHRKERAEFPLRGVVRCAECQYYFTAAFSRSRTRRYPYYTCHGASCPKRSKSYPAKDIHNEFDALLDRVAPQPGVVLRLSDHIVQAAQGRQKEVVAQRQRRQKQTDRLDRELQELTRMRAQLLITNQEFAVQRALLLERRVSFDVRNHVVVSIDEIRSKIREIVEPLADLRKTWHALREPFRGRFNRMLLPGGFVNGQSRTAQMGLLFSTFGASEPSNSLGVAPTSEELNRLVQEISELQEIFRASRGEKTMLEIQVR
jgi:DNA invertase Pin-like site-specific DNA recombinase